MKHRLTIFTVGFTLVFISVFQVAQHTIVRAATCTTQTATIPNQWPNPTTFSVAVNTGDTITVFSALAMSVTLQLPGGTIVTGKPVTGTASASGIATVIINSNATAVTLPIFGYTINICPADAKTMLTDGRCNLEADQSVAVYSDGSGGYEFYAIYNSVGYFALHLTKADLDANPDTGKNYMIKQAKGAQVWRLAGGKLLVKRLKHDGKVYEFIWPPCA